MVVVSLGRPYVLLLFLLLPQCMILRPWEGNIYVLILVWQYFLLSSFLQFCYWFRLNSRDTTGASTKNISVARRLHPVNFVERYLLHQSCLELLVQLDFRRILSSTDLTKLPIRVMSSTPTEVKYAFWPIYISVADCHFQPEEWPVVIGFIPDSVVTFIIDLYGKLYNKETCSEDIFLKRVDITSFSTLLLS